MLHRRPSGGGRMRARGHVAGSRRRPPEPPSPAPHREERSTIIRRRAEMKMWYSVLMHDFTVVYAQTRLNYCWRRLWLSLLILHHAVAVGGAPWSAGAVSARSMMMTGGHLPADSEGVPTPR